MIGIHKMMSTLKSFTDYQKWWSSPKMMTVPKTMQTPKSFWEKRCTSSKMMSLFKNDQFALSVQHTFLEGRLYYLLLFAKLWLHCMQVCGYITERAGASQVTTLWFSQGIPPSVISTPQFTWRGYHQARDLRGGFRICPLAGSARSFLNVLLPASDEQCFHFLKVKASRGALTIPLAWWELRLSKTL